jgi:hypothetical protein
VLLLVNRQVAVVPRGPRRLRTVVDSKAALVDKAALVEKLRDEVTDVQAEVLDAGLTAQLR